MDNFLKNIKPDPGSFILSLFIVISAAMSMAFVLGMLTMWILVRIGFWI